ncbi:hypothetical protein [Kitasatospora sp. NPDC090308]|uniref:hypothetical protein n=1 Tax=Kitasatospora sp. NPDC090308 TaxID=3364082 RepID=UPI0037FA177B
MPDAGKRLIFDVVLLDNATALLAEAEALEDQVHCDSRTIDGGMRTGVKVIHPAIAQAERHRTAADRILRLPPPSRKPHRAGTAPATPRRPATGDGTDPTAAASNRRAPRGPALPHPGGGAGPFSRSGPVTPRSVGHRPCVALTDRRIIGATT